MRDYVEREWIIYEAHDWLTEHPEVVRDALGTQVETMGGTLALTGTAERGRITINDAANRIIIDVDWQTMTRAEVEAVNARWTAARGATLPTASDRSVPCAAPTHTTRGTDSSPP